MCQFYLIGVFRTFVGRGLPRSEFRCYRHTLSVSLAFGGIRVNAARPRFCIRLSFAKKDNRLFSLEQSYAANCQMIGLDLKI